MLVAFDGSPWGDVALEQAIVLGRRFRATVVVAGVGPGHDAAALERALTRVRAAGLAGESASAASEPDLALSRLAGDADAVLIGRKRSAGAAEAAPLIPAASGCIIVCGSVASPMRTVGLAFDGGETSRRALELAAQFASVVGSTVHVIHANADREAGLAVVGEAEATLSLHEADYAVHLEAGSPGEVVARVVRRTGCDTLFVGAHRARPGRRGRVDISHAEQILRHTDIPLLVQP